jgi:hypothetical protein
MAKGNEWIDGIGGNSMCEFGIESRSSKRTDEATVYET